MLSYAAFFEWLIAILLLLSSVGVVFAKKPVYASMSFLVTLLALALTYLELSAQFIGVMQVLVYAGAILVIFMFVIILFQDAYLQIDQIKAKSFAALLASAALALFLALLFLGMQITHITAQTNLPESFGTVQSLGRALYIDFFLPFEAVILLFLISLVGAVYIGKKEV